LGRTGVDHCARLGPAYAMMHSRLIQTGWRIIAGTVETRREAWTFGILSRKSIATVAGAAMFAASSGLGLWLRTRLALLVEPVGFPPLWVGLRRVRFRLDDA
jgi:hypothetical protein